jgi:hypothetical protein
MISLLFAGSVEPTPVLLAGSVEPTPVGESVTG